MSAQQNRAPQARTESRSTSVANGSSRSGVGGVGGTGNQDVVHDMTNPAMVEAVHDSAALGPAEQINDLGAMQPFTQLDRMVEQSIPTSRNEEAIRIVEQELGANLDDNAIIHLDRYANVVAGTYNAEAVVIGQDVYVHRQVEERVVDILYPPQLFDNEGPTTDGDELTEPDKRPPWARHEDSEIVVTPGGYTIEMKDHEVTVYDRNEDIVTRIWGDPHVDEGGNGDDWHFGQDSTFILPDGAKICLDTKANQHGWWFVVGVDIIFGYTRFHYGVGDSAGMPAEQRPVGQAQRGRQRHRRDQRVLGRLPEDRRRHERPGAGRRPHPRAVGCDGPQGPDQRPQEGGPVQRPAGARALVLSPRPTG
jgi:hypothetical protein